MAEAKLEQTLKSPATKIGKSNLAINKNSMDTNFDLAKSHFLKGLELFNLNMYLDAESSFRASL